MSSPLAICTPTRTVLLQPNETSLKSVADYKVAGIGWNHNGQVLACVSSGLEKSEHGGSNLEHEDSNIKHVKVSLVLAPNCQILEEISFNCNFDEEPKSVCFGGKSRYLCVAFGKRVFVYDLKKKLFVRKFEDKSSDQKLHQASFDSTDVFVGALSDQFLYLYRLKEGTLAAKLTAESEQFEFSFFCFPHHDTQKVAAATRQGDIHVWDIKNISQKPTFSIKAHTMAVTGMAFSPVNKVLLASCGLDSKVVFYDVLGNKRIDDFQVSSPATAMAFSTVNGTTCAIGSVDGSISVYDLRKLDVPTGVWYIEDKTPIRFLYFANVKKKIPTSSQSVDKINMMQSTSNKMNGIVSKEKKMVLAGTTNSSLTYRSVSKDRLQNSSTHQEEHVSNDQDRHLTEVDCTEVTSNVQKSMQENQNNAQTSQMPGAAIMIPPCDPSKQKHNYRVGRDETLKSAIESNVSKDQTRNISIDEGFERLRSTISPSHGVLIMKNGSSITDNNVHSTTVQDEVPDFSSSLPTQQTARQIYSGSIQFQGQKSVEHVQEFSDFAGAPNRSNSLQSKIPNGSLNNAMGPSGGPSEFDSPSSDKQKIDFGLENISPISSKPKFYAPTNLDNIDSETMHSSPQDNMAVPVSAIDVDNFLDNKIRVGGGDGRVIGSPQNKKPAKIANEVKSKYASPKANYSADTKMDQSQRYRGVDKVRMFTRFLKTWFQFTSF